MDLRHSNVVPHVATSPEHARVLVARDGAALATGIQSLDDAVRFGETMLGEQCIRVRPQFEATTAAQDRETEAFAALGADERGRERYQGGHEIMQPAHYDGFGFGDFAPDHMFLWCERACDLGGASFLVDGLSLLSTLTAADPEFGRHLWTVAIDHSEPHFGSGAVSPIARVLPGGRVQVRAHPSQTALPGDTRLAERVVRRWMEAVGTARESGARFRASPGEMICIDNYRVFHGRDGYVDPARKLHSIWAWTNSAVAVPAGVMDISVPVMPEAR